MLAKQLQYFAGADSAGVVLGARVPVVLTSRADNVRMRIGSAAVAKLMAHARRAAHAEGGVVTGARRSHRRRLTRAHRASSSAPSGATARSSSASCVARCRDSARRRGFPRSERAAVVAERALARWPDAPRGRRSASCSTSCGRNCTAGRSPESGIASCTAGSNSWRPRAWTQAVLLRLERYKPLAPLHQPHNLAAIRLMLERLPGVPEVACFDTAFHRTIPEVAQLFALPPRFAAAGVRRYGFHGLSYEYVASRAAVARRTRGGRANGGVPPRQRLEHVRAGRRPQHRHDDGVHRGRRAADGHAHRGDGPRRAAVHVRRARHERARGRAAALPRVGTARHVGRLERHARPARERPAVGAHSRSTCSSTARRRELGSLAAALGGLDADRIHRRHRREPARDPRAHLRGSAAGSAWSWMPRRTDARPARQRARAAAVSAWVVPTDEETMIARHVARLVG